MTIDRNFRFIYYFFFGKDLESRSKYYFKYFCPCHHEGKSYIMKKHKRAYVFFIKSIF